MILPLGDRPRVSARHAWVVGLLATLLVLAHALRLLAPSVASSAGPTDAFFAQGAHPAQGGSLRTLLAHVWIHGDAWHLLGNLLFLLVFGPNVERRAGPVGVLLLFLACGAAGGLAFSLLQAEGRLIGASGAVLGLLAFHAVTLPRQRALILVWVLVVWVGEVPTRLLALALLALDLTALLTSGYGGGRVAVPAHLGGLGLGVALGLLARARLATARGGPDAPVA